MLRIGFDASPLIHPNSGIGRHTFHLFRSLLDVDRPEMEFFGYLSSGQLPEEDYSRWIKTGKLRWIQGRKWGRWMRKTDPFLDLFHGSNFKMPIQGKFGGILTIHDLWLDRYPQYSKKLFGQISSFYRTRRRAWNARKVIAVSQCTANDVYKFYGLPSERVIVIPNGVAQEFFEPSNEKLSIQLYDTYKFPSPKYLLFVGGASPRKNHKALLRALARCPEILREYCLVIIGPTKHRVEDVMVNARHLGIDRRVVCVGMVPTSVLQELYKGATLFVFPSLYEGFGLPVIEAMASGTPVITSNASAMPEVAGDAAVLVDPQDEQQLSDAIQNVLGDQNLRNRLRDLGRKRASQFSWKVAASKTANLYSSLCQ